MFENGFIYVTDSWGVLYKIDATSGEAGRIVWRMKPKQERQANNRGAARDTSNRGKYLQLQFTVDDEGAFAMPWSATITYGLPLVEWREHV